MRLYSSSEPCTATSQVGTLLTRISSKRCISRSLTHRQTIILRTHVQNRLGWNDSHKISLLPQHRVLFSHGACGSTRQVCDTACSLCSLVQSHACSAASRAQSHLDVLCSEHATHASFAHLTHFEVDLQHSRRLMIGRSSADTLCLSAEESTRVQADVSH
jgi:hypothetical protein